MPHDSGSLSVGDRMTRLEEEVEAHHQADQIKFGNVWEAINNIRLEMAKSQVKVALLVGVVSAVGSAVLGSVIVLIFTAIGK